MNVDLPHPEGPISAVTVARGMDSETRSSTFFVPNHAETFTASRWACRLDPAGPAGVAGGATTATCDPP